jgi:hypothetical protein
MTIDNLSTFTIARSTTDRINGGLPAYGPFAAKIFTTPNHQFQTANQPLGHVPFLYSRITTPATLS